LRVSEAPAFPQQVARASLVQIGNADLDPGTQAVQPNETLQSLLGHLGGRVIRVICQHGCGSLFSSAPNAQRKLMQLRKAEPVGPPDQHGGGVRQPFMSHTRI
jgi:hypothetical protein